jgi:hypothetical protein
MPEQIFVDYHFHPNFRFGIREANRAKRIWRAFQKHDLGVVVVSEHNWKSPRRSYELLEEHRPAGCRTVLLPGVEVLTREGLDIVVFSHDVAWYGDAALAGLLQPYRLTFDQTAEIVAGESAMAAYLPHPFTRGTTGAVEFYGEELAAAQVRRIGGVEVSNNSYDDCLRIVGRICSRVLPETHRRMSLTQDIAEEFLETTGAAFFAHGSDAHFPDEVGYGCLMEAESRPETPADAFDLVTRHVGRASHQRGEKAALERAWHASKSLFITVEEALQKRSIRKGLRRSESSGKVLPRLASTG